MTETASVDPIARVDAVRAVFPLKAPIMLGAMRIAAREFLCLRVTTEAGIEGYAFALSRGLPSEGFIAEMLAPALVGKDSDLIGRRIAECTAAVPAPSHPGMMKRAVSLVEIALWDVKGKRLRTPLWRLLGGARAEVPVLLVGGYLTSDTTPEAAGEKLGRLAAAGYTLFKVARAPTPELTRRLLSAAREHLPESCGLVVDTHWCWSSSAVALCEIAQWGELDLEWLEDPMPPGMW